ncbi:hypothetical protein [Calycomorphotria hydatis]|uniref:Uncharacterized protein n=1 Tax=Calycomorphotria hydatis TaxID=2528027 RepID=A0A517T6V6_9PLAN|nr:hypothetical protein [Calycomorphotria hydatis]QDT64103.1 hypothetical protein V22_13340 [Calycomorphotria hydatis]
MLKFSRFAPRLKEEDVRAHSNKGFVMTRSMPFLLMSLFACLFVTAVCYAQESGSAAVEEEATPAEGTGTVQEQVDGAIDEAKKKVDEVTKQLDESQQAKDISAGILNPIYALAEQLAFPAFHWIAFALMVTGVVSYALQLVLGKLVVLSRMGFSITEILSDALGLVISLLGLVLTTQAAAENSTFTTSAAAVLSAAALGVILGFIFYLWGQSQELAAVRGRREEAKKK